MLVNFREIIPREFSFNDWKYNLLKGKRIKGGIVARDEVGYMSSFKYLLKTRATASWVTIVTPYHPRTDRCFQKTRIRSCRESLFVSSSLSLFRRVFFFPNSFYGIPWQHYGDRKRDAGAKQARLSSFFDRYFRVYTWETSGFTLKEIPPKKSVYILYITQYTKCITIFYIIHFSLADTRLICNFIAILLRIIEMHNFKFHTSFIF